MGIFSRWKKNRIKVITPLNESQIKDNEIIKNQQQTLNALQSQLANIYSKEKLKKDKEKSIDKESEFNKKLNEQKEDLESYKYGKIISLDKFYYYVFFGKIPRGKITNYYSKWAKNLEFRDKNNEIVLGKFGGIGIMSGGKLCLRDIDGSILSYGKTLNHIMYKPDGFENMIKDKKILIPVDKDGNWLEDLDYKEIPEPIDAEFDENTGLIKRIIWSKVKINEVKKIIAEKMQRIHNLENELERQDMVVIKQKNEIDDLKRSLKVSESLKDTAQTNLSKNLSTFIEYDKKVGTMHQQILKLTEIKSTYENLLDKKDEIITQLIKKLELTGEPKLDQLKASIKDDLEFYKSILPEKVEIKNEIPPEPKQLIQPGDVIKK